MERRYFITRFIIILAIFTIGAVVIIPFLLPGGWTLRNITISLFFEGAVLIIFGACLGSSLLDGLAYSRYSVNPAVTRDTRRHASSRRHEQEKSGPVFLAVGGVVLLAAFLLLIFFPFAFY